MNKICRTSQTGWAGQALARLLVLSIGCLASAASGQEKIYFTSFAQAERSIQRANLDGSGMELLVTGLVGPFGLALDPDAGKMYWAEENGRRVARAGLDGSDFEVIVSGLPGFPADVALDLAAGKVYWVTFAGTTTHAIKRANLDGTGVESLVPLVEQGNRNGIAVDIEAGKIYWTLCHGIVRRANLDGSAVEDLITGLGCLGDIDLDPDAGKMYWVDATFEDGRIQRANLDGSAVEDLITGLILPFGLDVVPAAGHVYWTNSEAHSIKRANLDGSGVVDVITDIEGLYGIAIDYRPVFSDGFESGDTMAWSVTVP